MKFKLILSLVICNIFVITQTAQNKTFVPKKQWQTIEEGQTIPSGLHVRMNLQTGKKEAKLMDDENNDNKINKHNKQIKSLLQLPINEEIQDNGSLNNNTKNSTRISSALEEVLKNISKSDSHLISKDDDDGDDNPERIRVKFKSYEEIKKSLNENQMTIKSDFEIINDLFQQYENSSKYIERDLILNKILEDLNYLSHQIDNALWFIDKGGLTSIILPVLVNQTNINLRIKSLRVLGALTQNNPKVKIHVFEQNFGTYLTQILINSTDNDELSSGLYAFGSLLRNFPHAQKQILPKNGIKALMILLQNDNINIKIKLKVLLLINDLLDEYEEIQTKESHDSIKFKQYEFILMNNWLKNEGYCEIFGKLLTIMHIDLLSNIEILDITVKTMEKTYKICNDIWPKLKIMKKILFDIKKNFDNENNEDEFLLEIVLRLRKLNEIIFKYKINDEL